MPTVEVWTVGTGGDYSTPQLAEDALPASLVADDKQIDIALFNEEWVSSSTFTLNGVTVDATRNVRVIAYARPDITELPVRYNTSAGPCIRETGGFKAAVRCYLPYTKFVGIQIKAEGEGLQFEDGTNSCTIDQCLIEAGWQSVRSNGTVTGTVARNTVLIRNSSGGSNAWYQSLGSWTVDNCTVVRASNYTPSFTALDNGFSTLTVRNTVVSGFSTFSTGTPSTSSNNAGSMGTVPGSGSLNSLTPADLFEEPSNASGLLDLRAKAASALDAAGVDLSGSGVTADYAGTPRAATPFIGAWEVASAGVDELTADSIATGAPVLGTPALGQAHALAATGITAGAPTLGAPALGQAHALVADGLAAGAPVLGSPAVGQVHALAAPALAAGPPVLGTPTLAQIHALVAGGITTGAPVLGSPALNAPTSVAPAERTIAWAYQSRTAAWREESRVVSWPFRSRTVTWRQ